MGFGTHCNLALHIYLQWRDHCHSCTVTPPGMETWIKTELPAVETFLLRPAYMRCFSLCSAVCWLPSLTSLFMSLWGWSQSCQMRNPWFHSGSLKRLLFMMWCTAVMWTPVTSRWKISMWDTPVFPHSLWEKSLQTAPHLLKVHLHTLCHFLRQLIKTLKTEDVWLFWKNCGILD